MSTIDVVGSKHVEGKMLAWVRRAGGASIEEVVVPRVERADDVVVRVELVGICRTDLYAARGAPRRRLRA